MSVLDMEADENHLEAAPQHLYIWEGSAVRSVIFRRNALYTHFPRIEETICNSLLLLREHIEKRGKK